VFLGRTALSVPSFGRSRLYLLSIAGVLYKPVGNPCRVTLLVPLKGREREREKKKKRKTLTKLSSLLGFSGRREKKKKEEKRRRTKTSPCVSVVVDIWDDIIRKCCH